MKIGLISDVHGDPLSLELAWAHLTVMGAERILCAGDVVGYGPFPDRVVKFLGEHKIDCVCGNHDRWALERGPGRRCEFGGGVPSVETLQFLAAQPRDRVVEARGRLLVVVHGSPSSDMEYIVHKTHGPEVLDGLLDTLNADVLVSGHTHAPMCYRGPKGLVINPGATISLPVVRSSRTFALLDVDAMQVTFHDIETGRDLKVPAWT